MNGSYFSLLNSCFKKSSTRGTLLLLFLVTAGYVIYAVSLSEKSKPHKLVPPPLLIYGKEEKNIIYKNIGRRQLMLDIYQPVRTDSSLRPAVIFIHGGGWTKGDRSVIKTYYRQYILRELIENNISVISIDYSLINNTTAIRQSIADCKDAVRWAHKNAAQYQIDSSSIGIWGASAGGHLALMAAYTEDADFPGELRLKEYSSKVKFVVDHFGPTDLNMLLRTDLSRFKSSIYQWYAPEKAKFRTDKIKLITGVSDTANSLEIRQICTTFSPLSYVTLNSVPTLIMHGESDELVNIKQSELLEDHLKNVRVPHQFIRYQNLVHGFKNAGISEIKKISDQTVSFIKTYQ